MTDKYILVPFNDGAKIEPCDLLEWAKWFEDKDTRIIRLTKFGGGNRVSTVFLGIDHNFDNTGKPVLFETMFFHKNKSHDERRYCTLEEAIKGHGLMVKKWRRALKQIQKLEGKNK